MLASGVGRHSLRYSSAQAAGTWVCGCDLFFPSFRRLIESSLGSVATKLNFFIHNLAQMKFLGSDDRLTLSFAPRTHTLKSSGRISGVFLCRHEKVFHPNKGYVSVCSSLALLLPRHLACCGSASFLPHCGCWSWLSTLCWRQLQTLSPPLPEWPACRQGDELDGCSL